MILAKEVNQNATLSQVRFSLSGGVFCPGFSLINSNSSVQPRFGRFGPVS